ncbi:hypothetical protein, partial [Agrobacterium pusense]|uniref:hypothetical protein n=1 Tax=Agrobacterium pusense TaxID=648995 RepID=UPI001AECD84E
ALYGLPWACQSLLVCHRACLISGLINIQSMFIVTSPSATSDPILIDKGGTLTWINARPG